MCRRALVRFLVLLVVAVGGLGVVRPSWACGCGTLVTSAGSGVAVARETSIVRLDGSQEEIVMRLGVRSAAKDAAWLMPTPSRARVALGEQGWFEQLDAPRDFTRDLDLGYVADTPYREVEVETGGLVTFAGIPAFLWFLAVPVVAVATAVIAAVRRRRGPGSR